MAVKVGPARSHAVDMIVLHSTGGPTCDAVSGKPIWVGAGRLLTIFEPSRPTPSSGFTT